MKDQPQTKLEAIKRLYSLRDNLFFATDIAEIYSDQWQARKFNDSRDLMLLLEVSNEVSEIKEEIKEIENFLLDNFNETH